MTKLKKSRCLQCGKEITNKNMHRHIEAMHTGINENYHSDIGLNAIKNGLKNTDKCINHQRTRSTMLSLDGGIFRPFRRVKISDMTKAKEIRACGEEFSLYNQERTWHNRKKIVWVDEAEHGNPTYVPKNLLDRAIADGINI